MTSRSAVGESSAPFIGFTSLDANFLYCPNQFLDVCLPYFSRSVVRVVAFFLDQTLGWLDADGNPINHHVTISYRQLIASAGISHGAIRTALDEAITAGFIVCVREGRPAAAGESAIPATYALRWNDQGEYQDSPENFQGFYAGDGHRTPIPNAFFRHVIPNEPLTVTKVVGTVLRHTVGYQNQFGGRRSQAPLAYRFIQEYAHIPDPKTLSQAISSAIASKYILCVEEGRFDSNPNYRKPASYAVCWEQSAEKCHSGSKDPAYPRSKNPSSPAVQNSQQERDKKPSGSEPEIPAAERIKTPSKEKTLVKDTSKQQQKDTVAVLSNGFETLLAAGFDVATAQKLAAMATVDQITQQISWLPQRNPGQNRLGMLRRAIEQNWSAPERPHDIKTVLRERRERDAARAAVQDQEHKRLSADKQSRIRQRAELKGLWDCLSSAEQQQIESAAYANQQGTVLKNLFRTRKSHRLRECLTELGRELQSGEAKKPS